MSCLNHILKKTSRYDKSHNQLISSGRDLSYDIITSWPEQTSTSNFWIMCKFDWRNDSEVFLAIKHLGSYLFVMLELLQQQQQQNCIEIKMMNSG